MVAAALGVADLLASGPRSIADLSAATCADAQSLSTASRAATTGWRLLSLLGLPHLIRKGHRPEPDVKNLRRAWPPTSGRNTDNPRSNDVYINED